MCPKSNERDGNDEKEDSCIRKVAELEALLKGKTQHEETYLNQLKYARADSENLQKNTERRIDEGCEEGKRAAHLANPASGGRTRLLWKKLERWRNYNILEAIEMVKRKLWNVLHSEGLCPIESLGKPFDPHLHEAVLEIETLDHPEGTVIEEVKKGYLIKASLLKPSMVKIASNPRSHVPRRKINE